MKDYLETLRDIGIYNKNTENPNSPIKQKTP